MRAVLFYQGDSLVRIDMRMLNFIFQKASDLSDESIRNDERILSHSNEKDKLKEKI